MWKSSEVARLTGLTKRDVQKLCAPKRRAEVKEDRGNYAFMQVKGDRAGSTARTFDEQELFALLLAGQFKEMGCNLGEIARLFARFGVDGEGHGYDKALDYEIERLERDRARIERQLSLASGLRAVVGRAEVGEMPARVCLWCFADGMRSSIRQVVRELSDSEEERESFLNDVMGELNVTDARAFADGLADGMAEAKNDGRRAAANLGCMTALRRCSEKRAGYESDEARAAIRAVIAYVQACMGKELDADDWAFFTYWAMVSLEQPGVAVMTELALGHGGTGYLEGLLWEYVDLGKATGRQSDKVDDAWVEYLAMRREGRHPETPRDAAQASQDAAGKGGAGETGA